MGLVLPRLDNRHELIGMRRLCSVRTGLHRHQLLLNVCLEALVEQRDLWLVESRLGVKACIIPLHANDSAHLQCGCKTTCQRVFDLCIATLDAIVLRGLSKKLVYLVAGITADLSIEACRLLHVAFPDVEEPSVHDLVHVLSFKRSLDMLQMVNDSRARWTSLKQCQ